MNLGCKLNENNKCYRQIRKIINKFRYMLKQSKVRKNIVLIGILIVVLIGLLISINLISNGNRSDILRKQSWKDFMIYIDGHIIKMGDKLSTIEKIGFSSSDEQYNEEMKPGYTSGGLSFDYKESADVENTLFLSVYNSSSEEKTVSECELNGLDITHLFYKNYVVILPGGLVLDEELLINDIVKVWGRATESENRSYTWIDNNRKIRIYTNEDDTIFSVVYDY